MTELEEAQQRAERATTVADDWMRRYHSQQAEIDRLRKPFEVAFAGALWKITPPGVDGRPTAVCVQAKYP